MTTLNLTDSEPPISKRAASSKDLFSGNAAIYDRLQGRTKKSAMAKYGWVGIPIAAVAVLGIVAATSTPNRSADNIAAGPVDAKPAVVASQVTAPTPATDATPTQVRETIEAGSAAASAPVNAPVTPVVRRTVRPAVEAPAARAASAAPAQIIPAPAQSPTGPTTVNPPAASVTPPAALAPAPEVSAPAADPAPAVTPAPTESAPAAAETTPVQ